MIQKSEIPRLKSQKFRRKKLRSLCNLRISELFLLQIFDSFILFYLQVPTTALIHHHAKYSGMSWVLKKKKVAKY